MTYALVNQLTAKPGQRDRVVEILKAPQLRPYVEQAMPLLEGMPKQVEVRPRGGKGTGVS